MRTTEDARFERWPPGGIEKYALLEVLSLSHPSAMSSTPVESYISIGNDVYVSSALA